MWVRDGVGWLCGPSLPNALDILLGLGNISLERAFASRTSLWQCWAGPLPWLKDSDEVKCVLEGGQLGCVDLDEQPVPAALRPKPRSRGDFEGGRTLFLFY